MDFTYYFILDEYGDRAIYWDYHATDDEINYAMAEWYLEEKQMKVTSENINDVLRKYHNDEIAEEEFGNPDDLYDELKDYFESDARSDCYYNRER